LSIGGEEAAGLNDPFCMQLEKNQKHIYVCKLFSIKLFEVKIIVIFKTHAFTD